MKKGKIVLWLLCAALITAAVTFFFGKQGIYYPHRQLQRKTAEIETGRRAVDSLRREIEMLTNDTAAIERIAREKLGMAGEDEKVYKFIEKRKKP